MNTKKLATALIIASLAFSVTSCGGEVSDQNENALQTITVDVLSDSITSQCSFPEMFVLDADSIEGEFGVDPSLLSEFYAAVPVEYPGIERIFLAKTADISNTSVVLESLQSTFDTIKAEYIDYLPTEYEKAKDAEIISSGDFVALVISADSGYAAKIINESLN